jgi:hypothetical protein
MVSDQLALSRATVSVKLLLIRPQLTVNVCILTVMTYMGSSVYTMGLSGQNSVQSVFQVDQTITVYVLRLPPALMIERMRADPSVSA